MQFRATQRSAAGSPVDGLDREVCPTSVPRESHEPEGYGRSVDDEERVTAELTGRVSRTPVAPGFVRLAWAGTATGRRVRVREAAQYHADDTGTEVEIIGPSGREVVRPRP